MSKHTPGPWEVERHTAHSGTVATVYGNGGWWEVWSRNNPGQPEANARLIVAAPDMLEALEGLLDLLKETEPNGFPEGTWAGRQIEAAVDALAKARGES